MNNGPHKTKYVISMITNEATGEITIGFSDLDENLIHKITRPSVRSAKNAIKAYAKTGVLPVQNKKAAPAAAVPPAIVPQPKAAPLPPRTFEYMHRRCQQPVFVAEREKAKVNGMERVILILQDAAGKVYRIYEDLVERYLAPLSMEVLNG